MPSPLRAFGKDPNNKGRGKGIYYLRGKGIYSKYSWERDKLKLSKGWKTHKVGSPEGSSLLHTSDGKFKR